MSAETDKARKQSIAQWLWDRRERETMDRASWLQIASYHPDKEKQKEAKKRAAEAYKRKHKRPANEVRTLRLTKREMRTLATKSDAKIGAALEQLASPIGDIETAKAELEKARADLRRLTDGVL